MQDKPVIKSFLDAAQKRSIASRKTILHVGDAPKSLFLILEGSVSILLEDEDGREVVLAYLAPGQFFGEMGLFPEQDSRTAVVRTRQTTLVAEMRYEVFAEFVREHPDIMFEVAGQLAARLRDTSRRLGDLAFLDVAGRMAHALLRLCRLPEAQSHPRGTQIRVSRQELARLVGCSREMAGRVLRKMQEDGMVESSGRTLLVVGVTPTAPG